MAGRMTKLPSGIEVTQRSDTVLAWEYCSDVLGRTLEGSLVYTNAWRGVGSLRLTPQDWW